jgi:poly-gamma-glutamate synthesis protein (capsule biosynthesis protein)
LALAQNHAYDYGYEGLMATLENARKAGLLVAGAGRNLTEARAPAYFDTGKGTVAMLSACTTFEPNEIASEPRGPVMGRPGINGIRHYFTVDPTSAKEIKDIAKRLGIGEYQEFGQSPSLREGEFIFAGKLFVTENKSEKGARMKANEADLKANLRSIQGAARSADYVVMSLHFHQTDPKNFPEPPQFILEYARACIDAGADAFVGHGPQVAGAVEMYKGKPIFHTLGNFMPQGELVEFQPASLYERYRLDSGAVTADATDAHFRVRSNPLRWNTVIAITTFNGPYEKKVSELKLVPVTMSGDVHFKDLSRSQRGRPMLANEKQGREIIDRLKTISSAYGTQIEYRDGFGFVKLS